MFSCGPYNIKAGGLVDLKGLIVPCENMAAITITERDPLQNDGHTVLVPCTTNKKEFDLFVPKSGLIKDFMDNINDAANYLGFMNVFNPDYTVEKIGGAVTSITGSISNINKDDIFESNSYYSVQLEGLSGGTYSLDERIKNGGKCSAEPTNLQIKDSVSSLAGSGSSKYLVDIKFLLNQYGTVLDIYKEKLDISIYSDYLGQAISCSGISFTQPSDVFSF